MLSLVIWKWYLVILIAWLCFLFFISSLTFFLISVILFVSLLPPSINEKGNWFLLLVTIWLFFFKYIHFSFKMWIKALQGKKVKVKKKKSISNEFNIALPFDPAIPLLDICPIIENRCSHKKTVWECSQQHYWQLSKDRNNINDHQGMKNYAKCGLFPPWNTLWP